jgi:hypothetical protein
LTTLISAATYPLRWMAHKSSRDFAYRIFWSGIAFAHPTPDYRFCDGRDRRLTIFRIQRYRMMLGVHDSRILTTYLLTFTPCELAKCRDLATCLLMDGPDDVGTSQVKKVPWRCRGLNLVHFLC